MKSIPHIDKDKIVLWLFFPLFCFFLISKKKRISNVIRIRICLSLIIALVYVYVIYVRLTCNSSLVFLFSFLYFAISQVFHTKMISNIKFKNKNSQRNIGKQDFIKNYIINTCNKSLVSMLRICSNDRLITSKVIYRNNRLDFTLYSSIKLL